MDRQFDASFQRLKNKIEKLDISLSPEDEKLILSQLNELNFLIHGYSRIIPSFERLTINKSLPDNDNSTINEIKFLKNPPEESVLKYNRANLKRQSVLYATFILPTTISEMNPDLNNLVTISKWKLKTENTPLIIYPVFDYFLSKNFQLKNEFEKAIEKYPQDLKDIIIYDGCFIAACFSKYVEKGKEINYTLSAHIADKIFNKMYNGQIEALIYPSVKDVTKSDNIAIKPDTFNNKYKLEEVRESVVVSKSNDKVFLKQLKRTKEFDEKNILWE